MNTTDHTYQLVRAQTAASKAAGEGAAGYVDDEAIRRQAEAAWNSQPALRAEFDDKAAYVALCVAEANGRFRVARATVSRADIKAGGQRV